VSQVLAYYLPFISLSAKQSTKTHYLAFFTKASLKQRMFGTDPQVSTGQANT